LKQSPTINSMDTFGNSYKRVTRTESARVDDLNYVISTRDLFYPVTVLANLEVRLGVHHNTHTKSLVHSP
jgi:hypothetical protein